jgi:hypothetical protein
MSHLHLPPCLAGAAQQLERQERQRLPWGARKDILQVVAGVAQSAPAVGTPGRPSAWHVSSLRVSIQPYAGLPPAHAVFRIAVDSVQPVINPFVNKPPVA